MADPMSLDKLETGPLSAASTSFQTHLFVQPRPNLAAIKPTLTTRFVGMFILLMGIGALAVMIGSGNHPPKPQGFLLLAVSLAFCSVGALIAFFAGHFEFDRDFGEFRFRPWLKTQRRPLSDILAVQLVDGGWHKTKNSTYHTNQLIVVLADKPPTRLCLTNHSHDDATRMAAMELAAFLNVPLLDHIYGASPDEQWESDVEEGDEVDGSSE